MGYIYFNHKKFDKTLSDYRFFIDRYEYNMARIDNEINSLGSDWSGKDYNMFLKIWRDFKGRSSYYEKMMNNMKNYSGFLVFASNTYTKAQNRAIERAKKLPR